MTEPFKDADMGQEFEVIGGCGTYHSVKHGTRVKMRTCGSKNGLARIFDAHLLKPMISQWLRPEDVKRFVAAGTKGAPETYASLMAKTLAAEGLALCEKCKRRAAVRDDLCLPCEKGPPLTPTWEPFMDEWEILPDARR